MIASNSIILPASAASSTLLRASTLVYLPLVITTPIDVIILSNHSAYVTAWGSLYIVGEVRNNTNVNLSDIKISADLFNSRGQFLDSQSGYVYLENLPAGRKACFEIIFLNAPSGWARYEFNAPAYSWSSASLPNLTLLFSRGAYDADSGEYTLEGQVRNDQGSQVDCVRPVGTLYSSSGRVLGCKYSYVSSIYLNSGQVSAFEIQFYGRNYSDVYSHLVAVDGHSP
jgi:hypothetical protein